MSRIPLIVIVGPTASGKSSLAVDLAVDLDAEIVSADSMQVYRTMDIGTAKTTPAERRDIPHHLIDVADPDEDYDAGRYEREADHAVREIVSRGKPVIAAGGTGLYVRALTEGLFEGPRSDPVVRDNIRKLAEEKGDEGLLEALRQVDEDKARQLSAKDSLRIIRALEVYEKTGIPISEHHKRHRFSKRKYHILKIGIDVDREALYDRINGRVDEMISSGFAGTVQALLDQGYDESCRSMSAIGYRQMISRLRGDVSLVEAIESIKQETRRYAKRQSTWFGKDREIRWFRKEAFGDVPAAIDHFLSE